MGKINYTLLNASVLNASRLNMAGENGKPGGGAGGYWPDDTPAAIRRSAVLWYDIAKQGATNETMAANPVLKDLSGHGHDATCYNFGWGGMSGVGGYKWIFDDFMNKYFPYSGNTITLTHSDKTVFEDLIQKNELITLNMIPGTSVKVTGMQSGDSILLYSKIEGTIEGVYSPIVKQVKIVEDGIYSIEDNILPESYIEGLNRGYFGFKGIKINEGHEVTVEQLPQYPGALVSDGVDDYAVVDDAKKLTNEKGFTVIAKRKILSKQITSYYSALITDTTNSTDGAFIFEGIWSNSTPLNISFGAMSPNAIFPELESFLTSKKYNSYSIQKGDTKFGNDTYTVFATRFTDGLFGAFPLALYSLLLFDRDLTDEEIEWVKNNLIENNTEV